MDNELSTTSNSPALPIKRRAFLQSVGALAALSALPSRPLYGASTDVTLSPRMDGTVPVTFFEPVDVLICGSTLFACQLAIDSARAGQRTALVMDRVNPFFEGIACLRSWVEASGTAGIPGVLRGVVSNPATSETKEGKTYFNASKAALDIEDRLCESGVRFYYNAAVAGALGQAEKLAGVVFGGKTGLFAIEAQAIVDATADATVARAVGAKFTPVSGPRRYHYVADLAKPAPARQTRYTATNGARINVDIHHYYACFDLVLDSRSTGPFALAEDYDQIYAASLECPWDGTEKRFRGADAYLGSGVDRLAATAGRIAGFDNLLVFGPQGITGNTDGSLVLKDPMALFAAFPRALDQVKASLRPVVSPSPEYTFWNRGVPNDPAPPVGAVHSFHDHGFDEPGTSVAAVRFQPPSVAVTAEVLVIGGGTSGNAAAYASAGLGLKTVCLERGLELGGTNTVGGVTNLWFGNKTKGFDDYYAAM
ncbi:MAG: FAD-dependent oxidoreductase, partial [Opitutus sp.]|nr:FAD-dependent oxidoreductase [Opitutus sp.]